MALLRMNEQEVWTDCGDDHTQRGVAQMADQIIRLEDGKIVGEHHAGE